MLCLLLAFAPYAAAQPRSTAVDSAVRSQAAAVGRALVHSQSDVQLRDFLRRSQAEYAGVNILELLQMVMKEAIEQQKEDKKYFLQKLKMHNEIAKALSDYLSELNEASRQLRHTAAGSSRWHRLNKAAARVELEISKLPLDARASSDVRQLTESLRRDRQFFSFARKQLAAASSRPVPAPELAPSKRVPLAPQQKAAPVRIPEPKPTLEKIPSHELQ